MKRFLLVGMMLVSIRMVARADTIVLVAGGDKKKQDGVPAVEFRLGSPYGVDSDRDGNLFIAELYGDRLHKINRQGIVYTIAGDGTKGKAGDGGPARKATVNGMHGLAVHPSGDVYIADTYNHCVRKIESKTGIMRIVAGTGTKGFSGDGGPALQADFGGIYCVAIDPQGDNLYCTDPDNIRIRKVNLKSGMVTTVAGNGKRGVPTDGARATEAPLTSARAVAVDRAGNLYVLETGGHALRLVDAEGKIRTVAGTGKPGLSGDGGPVLQATFNGPKHLSLAPDDSVVIADTMNHVIRRYLPKEDKVVRIAGTGTSGSAGLDGDPLHVQLSYPHGVHVAHDGTVYIADSGNRRILKIAPKK